MASSIAFSGPRLKPIFDGDRLPIVRLDVRSCFHIQPNCILSEIEKHLPARPRWLDVGCGFGQFALHFAEPRDDVRIDGFACNAERIHDAIDAASRLGNDLSPGGMNALIENRGCPVGAPAQIEISPYPPALYVCQTDAE